MEKFNIFIFIYQINNIFYSLLRIDDIEIGLSGFD